MHFNNTICSMVGLNGHSLVSLPKMSGGVSREVTDIFV